MLSVTSAPKTAPKRLEVFPLASAYKAGDLGLAEGRQVREIWSGDERCGA